jgi:hypothetical protein
MSRTEHESAFSRTRVFWHQDISWPAIIAGAFTALALFAVAGILARAVGLGWTYRTALTTSEEAGAVIWGGVAALICFAVGGFVAAKTATRGSGGWNGFLVWAVCVPLLMLLLGMGMNPLVGRDTGTTTAFSGANRIYGTPTPLFNDDTTNPSARAGRGSQDNSYRDNTYRDTYRDNASRDSGLRDQYRPREPMVAEGRSDAAQTAAWWSLVSLAMGLIGAAGAGAMTASAERRPWMFERERERDRERDRDRPITGDRTDWVP